MTRLSDLEVRKRLLVDEMKRRAAVEAAAYELCELQAAESIGTDFADRMKHEGRTHDVTESAILSMVSLVEEYL